MRTGEGDDLAMGSVESGYTLLSQDSPCLLLGTPIWPSARHVSCQGILQEHRWGFDRRVVGM